ncbi:MAG TPA: hypothetical protein DHN33_06335 [Eubacteriaceae bacterium]|nr:hypothetical protein [Eubacteriaceae bacterium]
MDLSELINKHARKQSPYMGNLVNHLPMGQFALYQLTEDLDKVASYTEYYNSHFDVDPISQNYAPASSIEECLGERDRYEACLDLMEKKVAAYGSQEMIRSILNTYPLGISSGLFHVTIRLAYASEALAYDEKLAEEVSRALAYYVTAYREVVPFHQKKPLNQLHENIKQLMKQPQVEKILSGNESLGKIMKSLYQNSQYLDKGFLIEGNEENKVEGLLDLCLPAFDQTQSIVVLHCITGLHAMLVLKDHFEDFKEALDIYTTAVITHLLAHGDIDFIKPDVQPISHSWTDLIAMGSNSKPVHTIKFTYTCRELYRLQPREGLKNSLLHQINK